VQALDAPGTAANDPDPRTAADRNAPGAPRLLQLQLLVLQR
jgi:hypothetical protein